MRLLYPQSQVTGCRTSYFISSNDDELLLQNKFEARSPGMGLFSRPFCLGLDRQTPHRLRALRAFIIHVIVWTRGHLGISQWSHAWPTQVSNCRDWTAWPGVRAPALPAACVTPTDHTRSCLEEPTTSCRCPRLLPSSALAISHIDTPPTLSHPNKTNPLSRADELICLLF